MGKGKRRPNTVKGTRRGSKWPPEVKTACMAALLIADNLSSVAQKYGVPESTLRSWKTEAEKEGRDSVWARAREDAVRQIAYRAAEGARLNVEYLCRRIEAGDRAEQAKEQMLERLRQLGPYQREEALEKTQERERLTDTLNKYHGLTDFAATNILRTLSSVSAAGAKEREAAKAEEHRIEVFLAPEIEELAE